MERLTIRTPVCDATCLEALGLFVEALSRRVGVPASLKVIEDVDVVFEGHGGGAVSECLIEWALESRRPADDVDGDDEDDAWDDDDGEEEDEAADLSRRVEPYRKTISAIGRNRQAAEAILGGKGKRGKGKRRRRIV